MDDTQRARCHMKSKAWLGSGFLESVRRFPQRTALQVRGHEITYADLYEQASATAATLAEHTPSGGSPLTAVFAARCETAYVGVLAALLRGHGYVPLNPSFPAQRTRIMLERSDCRAVVVDPEAIETFAENRWDRDRFDFCHAATQGK